MRLYNEQKFSEAFALYPDYPDAYIAQSLKAENYKDFEKYEGRQIRPLPWGHLLRKKRIQYVPGILAVLFFKFYFCRPEVQLAQNSRPGREPFVT